MSTVYARKPPLPAAQSVCFIDVHSGQIEDLECGDTGIQPGNQFAICLNADLNASIQLTGDMLFVI